MIFPPVRNRSDCNVSHLSRTVRGYRCWSMNAQELSSLLAVCAKSNSILSSSFLAVVREDTKLTMRLKRRDTVGIHLPGERDDCVTVVQKLLLCSLTMWSEMMIEPPRCGIDYPDLWQSLTAAYGWL